MQTTPRDPQRERMRRRRDRPSRPGVSIMAQGEPLIWFTGAALATCLLMIVGFLLLVIWNGIPSFWPDPLVSLKLVDGQQILGEVWRSENYVVNADTLASLPAPESQAARQLLGERDRVQAHRRLFRTGNFELTGEHFRWVSDFAEQPGSENLPHWAVTVERLEWGRFYGEPRQFVLHQRRMAAADERELDTLLKFVEANRWRVAADQADWLNQATVPLQEALAKIRQARVAEFLSQFSAARDPLSKHFFVAEAGGQPTPLRQYQPGQNVVEVRVVVDGSAAAWSAFQEHHGEVRTRFHALRELERDDLGSINNYLEQVRLAVRRQELQYDVALLPLAEQRFDQVSQDEALETSARDAAAAVDVARRQLPADSKLLPWVEQCRGKLEQEIGEQRRELDKTRADLLAQQQSLPASAAAAIDQLLAAQHEAAQQSATILARIDELKNENSRYELLLATSSGQEKSLQLADVVRAFPANQLSWGGKLGVYVSRWWEFLSTEPREANSEGGVLPAIWGTIAMTFVMSLLVVPFGVLAALYMREYARTGWVVGVLRIAISNLAGVPSIVFGVFGLGFFCYLFGAYLDGGAVNAGLQPLAPRVWWLGLFAAAGTGVVAFCAGLLALAQRRLAARWWHVPLGYCSLALWLAAALLAGSMIFSSPYFGGFYAESLPNPTLGKGGLIWASLTLSLLTLPVVIVATEEALSAVPNSLREGSFACGASKWQTIRRIVLPHAMPGIMTGMILAMARGAGEVAPLMLVGAVKWQPELPFDGHFPFLHASRSFMHLAFHVFDLGFQSQNIDAAKPMVFTTTLLLIGIIAVLNFSAVWIRSQLRKRFQGSQF